MSKWEDNEEIALFREYLQIKSVHPDPDYESIVTLLKKQAALLKLEMQVFRPAQNRPLVVLTMEGKDPSLPSIMLNSHMDVVPVFEDLWTHKPFGAEIDEKGNIYARGAQDIKCLGTQYLSAIKYFRKNNIEFLRTIHVTFVPDEEVTSDYGLKQFVETEDFKKLNVGFALDEGSTSLHKDFFLAYYGERIPWRITIRIRGETGHGAMLLPNTAAEKLIKVMSRFYEFRQTQVEILEKDPLDYQHVSTINATIIKGGLAINIIPAEYEVSFDMRLSPFLDLKEFEKTMKGWFEEAGGDIEIIHSSQGPPGQLTPVDDSNPFWTAMKEAIKSKGYDLKARIMPASTDARFLRKLGYYAIGFAPMSNVPITVHAHDEFIPADMYLEGIEVFKKVIEALANVKKN